MYYNKNLKRNTRLMSDRDYKKQKKPTMLVERRHRNSKQAVQRRKDNPSRRNRDEVEIEKLDEIFKKIEKKYNRKINESRKELGNNI